MTAHSTRRFYDDLADEYHLLYPDWQAGVERQGAALDRLIHDRLGPGGQRIWDCACGIGTQALGLAARGHDVLGTDLSPAAAARAAREADARGLRLRTAAGDMRRPPVAADAFDVVLCADNSLAHLLTEADINAALRAMHRSLRPGGLLLLGMRDYEQARAEQRPATLPQVTPTEAGRSISFQLWHWHPDGERYDLEHIQLLPNGAHSDDWQVRVRRATSWALSHTQISDLVTAAGFRDATWLTPQQTGFIQPILNANKAP
ncbi:class I SAM-dependent methyltransferase [Streptacidiphilus sp. P02-A3a]|uniref:class I SAM-dependent methyltransferase n=1 Tax=Streptacidiphilus sp. P02-A3a TaxID=2704468 RepID=UPI0015F89EA5|nr:class I SAM-dependent methyltransferase [Streptacidiphilus sp. P02-A3a]QMU72302.1 class I SAM-dependent methyltransferase [Streptacidiphilus sp. P02-A3a]